MKHLHVLAVLGLLAGCPSGPSSVNYVVNFRVADPDNPPAGLSAFYRIGSEPEVAVTPLRAVIQLPQQPSGTAISARARLTGAGTVTVFITADGETCQSANTTNSGSAGETREVSVACTR